MRILSLVLLPFEVVWALAKALFVPALLVALAWWWAPHSWAVLVTWLVGGYVLLVLWLTRLAVRGRLRSMGRGAVTIRSARRHPRRGVRR